MPQHKWMPRALPLLIISVIYYTSARLGLFLAFENTNVSPVWPPSGIALAALLVFGLRYWPAVTVGAFAANMAVFVVNGVAEPTALVWISMAISTGNTLEAAIGTYLLRPVLGDDLRLKDPNRVYLLTVVSAFACAVGASIGSVSLVAGNIVPPATMGEILRTWWMGDVAGIAVMTPLILAWRGGLAKPGVRSMVEASMLVLALLFVFQAFFARQLASDDIGRWGVYLLLPCIGWAAYRFRDRGVATVLFLVTGAAVWSTTRGLGPFAVGTLNDSLLALEIFLALCSMVGLVLAADISQRTIGSTPLKMGVQAAMHWLSLFVFLGVTIYGWHAISSSTDERAGERFRYAVDTIAQSIHERMMAYEQVLLSANALFDVEQSIERDQWRKFVTRLAIDRNLPGIQGVGFAEIVRANEKAQFEKRVRDEGFADFRIWPEGNRPRYAVITYLEPFSGRNLRAFGYDMFSEPIRSATMLRAASTGEASASDKVTLVQEDGGEPQAGFLLYLPIYRHGMALSTPEERLAALHGFVYSPFRMNDLMHGILGRSVPEMALEIYSGTQTTESARMYRSQNSRANRSYPNSYTIERRINVEDRIWTLRVTSLPAFEASIDRQKSLIVLVGGTIISLLLFSVVRSLTSTREKALALASEMTLALRDSETRFRSLVESASEFSIIATDTLGTIQTFSVGAERMLGYRATELVGKTTPAIIHLEEEMERRADELTAETGKPIAGFEVFVVHARNGVAEAREWTYVRKDGSRLPVQLTVTPIRSDNGELTGFVGIAKDITQEKRTADELRSAKLKAESASRAKSEFVANMSHELRTPMNAVLGMTYLLSGTALSPDQKKYVEMVRTSGQSLLQILNDILDFSKIEAGRMELSPAPFQVGDVLKALATIMSVNAGEKDLELAIGVEPDVPLLLVGDALRLQQVLVNLAGNAIKFTERGEVAVLVECVERQGQAVQLRFTVRDTGIGMSEEQQERLYLAFAQADSSMTRRFGGTGLGLTISRQLVELMGGSISVRSAPGQGSTFSVTVPMALGGEDGQSNGNALGRLRLLVVDDNATSRQYLGKTIRTLHWEADCVESGARALECLRVGQAGGQGYDAVLADWQMPDMDGVQTMQALRAVVPAGAMPIMLMVSVFGRGKLMQQDVASLADAVLLKPLTGPVLHDALHELLVARAGHAEAAAPAASALYRLDGARLLLVEDNPLNQAVARGMLEQAGALVEVADDGQNAVQLLRADRQRCDLVLMDVQMPVMDGFTATGIIRGELGLDLPVLAMTAGVMESERQQCMASGMNDFITKPIDVEKMFATILRHLPGQRVVTAQPQPVVQETGEAGVFDVTQLMAVAQGQQFYVDKTVELIGRIIDGAPQLVQQARQAWEQGCADEAARLFHMTCGSIGTLGAMRYVAVAREIENAMHARDAARVAALFEQVDRELAATVAAGRQWLAGQVGKAPEDAPAQLDREALAQLRALLAERNLGARTQYRALRSGLAQAMRPEDLQALERAIDQLDFDAALQGLVCLEMVRN